MMKGQTVNSLQTPEKTISAPPAAAKNRVTDKTLAREVLSLMIDGDPDIMRECDEYYQAYKLTPEAHTIVARVETQATLDAS